MFQIKPSGAVLHCQHTLGPLSSHWSNGMRFQVNGSSVTSDFDPRTSLLDLLREHLRLSGTKKGCNQGACGACTVLVDGVRILACLTLAAQCEGRSITTIE